MKTQQIPTSIAKLKHTKTSTLLLSIIGVASFLTGNVQGQLCGNYLAGSAVLSDYQYYSGDFQFKIKPALTDGVVTVFGIANDGAEIADPYYQIVFDSATYGVNKIGIEMGGVIENSTYTKSIDVSSISDLATNNITNFTNELFYKIKVTSQNLQIYVGKTTLQPVFDLSQESQQSGQSDLQNYLTSLPSVFNLHLGTWYKTSSSNQMDLSQVYESKFSDYQQTDSEGYTYTSLDFTSKSLVDIPFWSNNSLSLTTFQASSVRLNQDDGTIGLTLRNGLLPHRQDYYTTVPSGGTINIDNTSATGVSASISLADIKTNNKLKLQVQLEVSPSSATYLIKLNANFTSPDATITSLPIKVYIATQSYPYNALSTVEDAVISTTQSDITASPQVSIAKGTSLRQDRTNYAMLIIDFGQVLTQFPNANFANTVATINSMQMTVECITETKYTYGPQQIITTIDKVEYTDEVTDLDFKSKYEAAIIVFSIFLVILLAAISFLVWVFLKNRKVLIEQTKEAKRLEDLLAAKKREQQEHQALIQKHEERLKQDVQSNNQVKEQIINQIEEEEEDALQIVYDADGFIRRNQKSQAQKGAPETDELQLSGIDMEIEEDGVGEDRQTSTKKKTGVPNREMKSSKKKKNETTEEQYEED